MKTGITSEVELLSWVIEFPKDINVYTQTQIKMCDFSKYLAPLQKVRSLSNGLCVHRKEKQWLCKLTTLTISEPLAVVTNTVLDALWIICIQSGVFYSSLVKDEVNKVDIRQSNSFEREHQQVSRLWKREWICFLLTPSKQGYVLSQMLCFTNSR